MPVTYRVHTERRAVEITGTGNVTVREIEEMQRQLLGDPDFRPDFGELADFRAAVPVDLGTGQVSELIRNDPFSKSARHAYVVSPGVMLGLGNAAMSFAGLQQVNARLFQDIDAAWAWLAGGK